MASCLWIYPCLLSISVFTSMATQEINENITCTFTNGKDCSHLLDPENTTEYIIEKEDINRTGVKIIFDSERRVQFLHIQSGLKLENRVRVLNITRGSLNHLVNLSCTEETQVDKIKLEPVVVSKEIQIDFVQGCGNDSDRITIKNLDYTVVSDKDAIFKDTTDQVALEEATENGGRLSEAKFLTTLNEHQLEETQTDGVSIPDGGSGGQYHYKEQTEKIVKSTFTIRGHLMTKAMKTTLSESKKPLMTTKKIPVEKSVADETNLKVGASKSSGWKVSTDIVCLFLALFIFQSI